MANVAWIAGLSSTIWIVADYPYPEVSAVGLRLRRMWRGKVRLSIKELNESCQTIINYYNKHPTYPFLDTPTATAIAAVQTWCAAKLAQTSIA
jgi:hypothetical protein